MMSVNIILLIIAMFVVDSILLQVSRRNPAKQTGFVVASLLIGAIFGYAFTIVFSISDLELRLLGIIMAAFINLNGYFVILRIRKSHS
jgi:hypothetical protein